MTVSWSVVVPTIGRPQLSALLASLAEAVRAARDAGLPGPAEAVVVDDRPFPGGPDDLAGTRNPPLDLGADAAALHVRVVRTGGRGPAAARNAGWRNVAEEWVAFLDDDVVVPQGWAVALVRDLAAAGFDVGGVQGLITVPLPAHRRPTDAERGTAGLERAAWATADMAYRRAALARVHGFDERFPRAYREDADLALRVRAGGSRLVVGDRQVTHPVRPSDDLASLRAQAGNRDDALMRALHGPRWRELAEAPRGRLPWHVATVAAGVTAALAPVAAAVLSSRPFARAAVVAGLARGGVVAGLAWAGLTAGFLARRLVPGLRPGDDLFAVELRRMLITSVLIPPAAVAHRLAGTLAHRGAESWPLPVRAVLFDRDGTLVHDVPYNGDPDAVRAVLGARRTLDALRVRGICVGVVSNQSAIGRGILTAAQVDAVEDRVRELLGPFATWQRCPHAPEDGCTCRKPEPGLVLRAARALRLSPAECALVGDIGSDVDAAVAAGARAVLVPTPQTRGEEVAAAPAVAATLGEAVRML